VNRPVVCVLLLNLAVAPGFSSTLFDGIFAADSQVALFTITVNTVETVTIQTYSYGGGTVNSVAIPAGGFAPTAFLFDSLGDVVTLTNPSPCGPVATDPATGNCDDLFFQDTLAPGTYTLALAVYDNAPVDASVSDGFVEDGNPGFTCQQAGVSGSFCDLTTIFGTSRTGTYAVAITGADSIAEPDACDLEHTGSATVADLQLIINEALGVAPAANDLNGDGLVNVVDIQIEIDAVLGMGCAAR
jgi:hypothetical protein